MKFPAMHGYDHGEYGYDGTTALLIADSCPMWARTTAGTGLDYFGARYFSGAQGRFTSPDPLLSSGRPWDPQSWNRYSYVLNNPLRYTDPLGLYVWDGSLGGDTSDDEVRKNYAKKQAN